MTPSTFARGWFLVAFTDELSAGQVMPLRYFGREWVLFRTEAGEAQLLAAHCPHLGAHMGHGGKVVGEDLVCPFHAWQFNGEGRCTAIPYAKTIPKRARVDALLISEQSGMIMAWHDSRGGAPDYEIPRHDEVGQAGWTPWQHRDLDVNTTPWEVIENVVDVAHFMPVHRTRIETFENSFDAHRAVQHSVGYGQVDVGGDMSRYEATATYHGPGIQLTEMDGYFPALLINAHTPVDAHRLRLRVAVSVKMPTEDPRWVEAAKLYVGGLMKGFHEDIVIWENKRYLDAPTLCDGDGPIMRLRKWYRRFYLPSGAA